MPAEIHPTAIIERGAELAEGVRIGAYAYIGSRVRLGTGTLVHHHATIDGTTSIGARNTFFPYVSIGLPAQDLKYRGGYPALEIGDDNVFREFSTVHCATYEGDVTRIGVHSYFLAYVHIAHNCNVGDHVIMSNNATLAGHVTVESHANIAGFAGVHQFCRIGRYAMLGGYSKVVQDVPPFMMCDGNPAVVRAPNRIGLERGGFTREEIGLARHIFKVLYKKGLSRPGALRQLEDHPQADSHLIQGTLAFIQKSTRGLT